MAKRIISNQLWTLLEPLLPEEAPKPKGGRPRVSNRAALTGILFVLKTGIPWEDLPPEMGCGSGMTCWRRLRDWQEAGIWAKLHIICLDHLAQSGNIDWERVSLDSASIPSPTAKKKPVTPLGRRFWANRAKLGTKRHIIVDKNGTPLAVVLSGANIHDSMMLEATLDAIPCVRSGKRGRPCRKPKKLHADKGYDYKRCRDAVKKRGITPRIARRGIEQNDGFGKHRWVVERTLAWLSQYRRLRTRYEQRSDIHLAFTLIAFSLICIKQYNRFC